MKLSFLFLLSLLCTSLPVSAQTDMTGAKLQIIQPEAKSDESPWLDVGIEQRTCYETLDHRFRLGEIGRDQQLPLMTRFRFEIKRVIAPLGFMFEFQDSRACLTDLASTVTNGMINDNDISRICLSFTMKLLGETALQFGKKETFDHLLSLR